MKIQYKVHKVHNFSGGDPEDYAKRLEEFLNDDWKIDRVDSTASMIVYTLIKHIQ